MSEILDKFREDYPQYGDRSAVSDARLAAALWREFYSEDIEQEDFNRRIGFLDEPDLNILERGARAVSETVSEGLESFAQPEFVKEGGLAPIEPAPPKQFFHGIDVSRPVTPERITGLLNTGKDDQGNPFTLDNIEAMGQDPEVARAGISKDTLNDIIIDHVSKGLDELEPSHVQAPTETVPSHVVDARPEKEFQPLTPEEFTAANIGRRPPEEIVNKVKQDIRILGEMARDSLFGELPEGAGYLQYPMEYWSKYFSMTPEEEMAIAEKHPNLMAARYAIASLLPFGEKLVSPTEMKKFTDSTTEEQRLDLIIETAGWAIAPALFKGVLEGAGWVAAKLFPRAMARLGPVLSKPISEFTGAAWEGLKRKYRKFTSTTTLDDLIKEAGGEAAAARKYPEVFEELLKRSKAPPEGKFAEPTPAEPGPEAPFRPPSKEAIEPDPNKIRPGESLSDYAERVGFKGEAREAPKPPPETVETAPKEVSKAKAKPEPSEAPKEPVEKVVEPAEVPFKEVKSTGEPTSGEVFHGTSADIKGDIITQIDFGPGRGFKQNDLGAWFTDDRETAQFFAESGRGDNPRVITAEVKLESPLVLEGIEELQVLIEEFKDTFGEDITAKDIRRQLIQEGRDGIIIKKSTTDTGKSRTDIIVFDPKSLRQAPIDTIRAEGGAEPSTDTQKEEPFALEGQTPEQVEAATVKRLEEEKAEPEEPKKPDLTAQMEVIREKINADPSLANLKKIGPEIGEIQNNIAVLQRSGLSTPEAIVELTSQVRALRQGLNDMVSKAEGEEKVTPEPEPKEAKIETVIVNWPKAGDLPIEGAVNVGQKSLKTGKGTKKITYWRIDKNQLSEAREAGATWNKKITQESIYREEAEEVIREPAPKAKGPIPVKPGQRVATPKEFNTAKDKFLKEIDGAIKKAEDVTALRDVEEAGLVKFVDPFGAEFEVINSKKTLQEFKKAYRVGVKRTPDKIVKKKPSKPSVTKPITKESWGPDIAKVKDAPEEWITDGMVLLKQTDKKIVKEKGDLRRPGDASFDWETTKKVISPKDDLTDATLQYYVSPGEAGYSVSMDPVVNVLDEYGKWPMAVFKVGDKFYGFQQNQLNIITNRYPDAKFKIEPSGDYAKLQAYDDGEIVGVILQPKGGQDIEQLGLKEARDFGIVDPEATKADFSKGAGLASTGEYATNIKMAMELPEIVQLAKELLGGKYPQIVKIIRAFKGQAKGVFYPLDEGLIKLRADLAAVPGQLEATLAHEIGHLVDYLPDHLTTRGNILGRIASLSNFMKHTLALGPGQPGPLTAADRRRLKYQAQKMVDEEGAERWIDEFIRKEFPITPQDVLNIWNAIEASGSIHDDLLDYVKGLNTPQKKAIVKDAMKGVVTKELQKFARVIEEKTGKQIKVELGEEELKDLVGKKYADLINEELAKRKLYDLKDIIVELQSLTLAWKPFDPNADPAFTKYRFSSVELYADAISALINAPGLLKSHAPKFYEAFFNYLERKPEVKKLYEQIQDEIVSGKHEVERTKRVYEMFRKGDDAYALSLEPDHTLKEKLMRELVDVHSFLFKKVKMVGEREIPPRDNPRYAIEEMTYTGAELEWYLTRVNSEIIKPLEKVSLDWEVFGFELLMRRIAGERAELPNPQGWTPKLAKEKLESLKAERTDLQNQAMAEAAKTFRGLREYIIQKGEQAGRWDKELLDEMKNNDTYAAFDVVKYIEKRYGLAPAAKIYKQMGTFEDIANPATATTLKDMAIIKAVNRQHAAEVTVKFLIKNYSDEIRPAEKKWSGKIHAIQEPERGSREGLIVYLKKGKPEGWYVNKWIADSFDSNPWESEGIARLLQSLNQPFRTVFTELNPGFWLFNINRDYWRAVQNLPEAKVLNFTKAYLKGIKPAFRSVFGIPDEVIERMLQGRMLISVADYRGQRFADTEQERLLKRYHFKRQTWENEILKPFGTFFTYFTNIGRALERMPKVGGYLYLKEKFPDMPDEAIGHLVRKQAGSPDFLSKGRAYPIYNNLLLFSNAMKEGYRGDWEAFSDNKAEFMWKKAKYVFIPKVLMYMAQIGMLGAGTKVIMDGVSEYDKTNYHIIPLGITENGKSVYLRVPIDETGRFMGGILWKLLSRKSKNITTGLSAYMAGQTPTLNPGIDILINTMQYASGLNPYDSYRGQYAIPEQVQEAGGRKRAVAFAKWLSNKSGGSIVYRFKSNNIKQVRGELEKITGYPIASNIIGRFLRVTDQGLRETNQLKTQKIRQRKARENLAVKDAIAKIINGKADKLTKKDKEILVKRSDAITRNMKAAIGRKYGNVFATDLYYARSKEEKAAILQEFFKRQELLKKAGR